MTFHKSFIRFISQALFVLLIVLMQIGLVPFLPFPLTSINLVLVWPVLLLMSDNPRSCIWFSFTLHFFLELFAVTPFGFLLLVGTLTFVVVYFLSQTLIINRTIVAGALLSICAVVIYRLMYSFFILFIYNIKEAFGASPATVFIAYWWELIITIFLVSAFIYLGKKFFIGFSVLKLSKK